MELHDERGLFGVDCMDNSLVWSCEGSSPQRRRPREAIRRCVPPVCESAWIKIIHVCDFDGLLLRKICNLPVPLTEQSASVASVSQFVSQEAFGGGAVVLLDWENLILANHKFLFYWTLYKFLQDMEQKMQDTNNFIH